MISRTIWLAAAFLTMALAGYASGGNEVLRAQDANAVDRNIVDGRTTRSDVERIYGPPNATSFADAQNDIWIYRWVRSTARAESFIPYVGVFVGGSDVQKKELVILFNEQNTVVRHSMRDIYSVWCVLIRKLSRTSTPISANCSILSCVPASVPPNSSKM